ncbi:DUF11 domain-containing protein [Glaciihabitans arcticus]|uniref:DUF11 domain-containing protein n=1 Tax=Glaciihabitans arcticus TaxID=2668039 RepID=A0A4Q9GQR6_9MICO|nr:SdrD B-like domain-containing protein [Glaciihabitans arcticus]TBN57236.1 DUF11 domain-containing protein [Glaciihabitans arcticus]
MSATRSVASAFLAVALISSSLVAAAPAVAGVDPTTGTLSIGNRVFLDDGTDGGSGFNAAQRNNGVQDSNEKGVDGVRVELYEDLNLDGKASADEWAGFDVTASGQAGAGRPGTDAKGYYLFDYLTPGTYIVVIPSTQFTAGGPLAGWHSSSFNGTATVGAAGAAGNPATDLDDNGAEPANRRPDLSGVASNVIQLAAANQVTGETDLSLQPSPGFPTDEQISPTGWDGAGSIGRGSADAGSNIAVDFGFVPPMSIGNRVWLDDSSDPAQWSPGGSRNNGLIDATDDGNLALAGIQNSGIANVDLQLYFDENNNGIIDAGDTLVSTTTSAANGYYLFDGLAPGRYLVRVPSGEFAAGQPLNGLRSSYDAVAQVSPTNQTDGNDNGIDATSETTTGVASRQIELAYLGEPTGESDRAATQPHGRFGETDSDSDLTIDFGFLRAPTSLGNQVWADTNNNGLKDAGEPVTSGVSVALYRDVNANGSVDAGEDTGLRRTTDADGFYLFSNLPPGNYVVVVEADNFPAGGPLFGKVSSRSVAPNPLAVDNQVDNNDTGRDAFVSGVGFVSPMITLSAGTEPTGETPFYQFGRHGNQGERDVDSDLTVDFGFTDPSVSVGDFVWRDTNENGVQNAGEPGIAGVTVTIVGPGGVAALTALGATVGPVTTGPDGSYSFTNLRVLPSGQSYTVRVDNSQAALAGYVPTVTGQGTTATDSSDGSASSGDLLVDGASNLTLDFGFAPLYAVGDFVWSDTNRNGRQDAGEPGLEGVTVELLSAADIVLATTTSGPAGYYVFDGRRAGTYKLRFAAVTNHSRSTADAAVATDATDSDAAIATGMTGTISLSASSRPAIASDGVTAQFINTTADAGYLAQSNDVSIAHTVGSVDSTLKTITWNVTVTNTGPDATKTPTTVSSTLATALTFESDDSADVTCTTASQTLSCELAAPLASGAAVTYSFVTSYTGYPATIANTVTAANAFDLISTNDSATATATSFPPKVAIGNFVWIDTDRDGIQDAGEPGVPGHTVKLLTPTGAARHTDGTIVTATTTDANGFYAFDDLTPGTYIASFGPLSGHRQTQLGAGTSANDSNVAPTGMTAAFTVAATATGDTRAVVAGDGALDATLINDTIDAGFTLIAFDAALSKSVDSVDTSAKRITWELTVTNDGPDATTAVATVTDELATDLTFVSGGSADVTCTTSGQTVTCVTAAPLASGDSLTFPIVTDYSGYPATLSNTATVVAGAADTDLTNNEDTATTTAFPPKVAIGNFVWLDSDRDGIQDAGEPGIAGVTVKLLSGSGGSALNTDGSIVTYTTTDANGFYAFDDLTPGSYIASSGLVTGAVRSPLGAGTGATDSNFAANGMTAAFTVAASATGDTRAVVPADGALDATLINDTIDAGFMTRTFDVSIVKSFGSVNTSMRRVTWNLTVTNTGPDATAAAVTVTDVLPTTLTFVSGGSADVTCSTTGQTVSCVSAAPLASGATLTFPIVTSYRGYPATLSNTATVAAGTGDADASNDSSSATTPRLPAKPVVVPPATPTTPGTGSGSGSGTGSGSGSGTVTPEPTATATPEPTVEPTATPEPTESATPPAPSSTPSDDAKSGIDVIAIILWAIGAILLILLITGAVVFFRRRAAI